MIVPIHLTDADLEAQAWRADTLCVIEFWSFRSEMCRLVAPLVSELARTLAPVPVYKVNVDDQPRLAARFAVPLVPCLMVVKGGRAIATYFERWSADEVAATVTASNA